jgi:hypothetical protein
MAIFTLEILRTMISMGGESKFLKKDGIEESISRDFLKGKGS